MHKLTRALTGLTVILMASCASQQNDSQIEKRVDNLLTQMTLEEKVSMIHANAAFTSGGVERLGIPEWCMSDGPHGVRMEHARNWGGLVEGADDESTYLPTGITLASTWNTELSYQYGKVLGSEARNRGKDVILGPGVNIIRTPLNGRNFEYFSEDPFLTGRIAVEYIKGVQTQDVAACVKHYAANNQETLRTSINVEMSDRALHEIYLPAFRMSVEDANVYTVMGAYNQFRGQHATHHKLLVNEILKDDYGFDGVLLSDWSAVQNTMEALLYGTDLEMGTDLLMLPNPDYSKFFMADTVVTLVREGKVEEALVEDKVRRILRIMHRINMFDDDRMQGERNTAEHKNLALQVAEEGMVLLKNDGLLPLNVNDLKKIAVIGDNAVRKHATGGGSSQVKPPYEVTPLEGITSFVGSNAEVTFIQGYKVDPSAVNTANPELIEQAVSAAKQADVVILVGGFNHGYSDSWDNLAFDAESADKDSIILPFGQDKLFKAVIEANPNTIVVLKSGGAIDMSAWVEEARGILFAWYAGQEGGNAIANILFGETNPSGKLPVVFPKKLEDHSAHALGEFPGDGETIHYNDDIFVGYRYAITQNIEPLFPFGYGLSYTTFQYNDLNLSKRENTIEVTFSISNTGAVAGAEVAQVYVKDLNPSLPKPDRELKGFTKVHLEPGEEQSITLSVPIDQLKHYDEATNQWVLNRGEYMFMVGNSSVHIELSESVTF